MKLSERSYRPQVPRALTAHPVARLAVVSDDQTRGQIVRCWWLMVAMVLSCWLIGSAQGQEAAAVGRPLPENLKTRDALQSMERAKSEGLTKADFSEQWGNYRIFQTYYQNYLLGKLMDPAYVAEYGTILQTLQDDMERAQRSRSPSYAAISNWVLRGSAAIAAGNFHPSARVNATLLLAYLDDKPADPRAGTPPVPSKDALSVLVRVYRDANSPDGAKAAALQGILRHAQLGAVTDPAMVAGIVNLMQKLTTDPRPAGRDPAAHAFLQRYAVDVLNLLANPIATPKTAETLVALSTRSENPDLIAAYAAAKLGQFKTGQTVNADPQAVLKSWAVRLSAVVDAELDRIAGLDPPLAVRDQPPPPVDPSRQVAGGGMGGMMGGYTGGMMEEYNMSSGSDMMASGSMGPGGYESMDYDMMMSGGMGGSMGMGMMPRAKPQPVEVVASRRRINQVFQQLQQGVTGQATTGRPQAAGGLLVAETPATKAAFDQWIKAVDTASKAINLNTLDNRKKYVDELLVQSDALRKLAGLPLKSEIQAAANRPAGLATSPRGSGPGTAAAPPVGTVSIDGGPAAGSTTLAPGTAGAASAPANGVPANGAAGNVAPGLPPAATTPAPTADAALVPGGDLLQP